MIYIFYAITIIALMFINIASKYKSNKMIDELAEKLTLKCIQLNVAETLIQKTPTEFDEILALEKLLNKIAVNSVTFENKLGKKVTITTNIKSSSIKTTKSNVLRIEGHTNKLVTPIEALKFTKTHLHIATYTLLNNISK